MDSFYIPNSIRKKLNMKTNKIDYKILTPELRELLVTIQKTPYPLDVYGYTELIDTVLNENRYRVADTIWLNTVRRKWINYLKEKTKRDAFTQHIIENTKSW